MRPSRRWTSFAGVGLLGFVLQGAALDVMTRVANLPSAPATAVAVELAILHNFLWHERWTWRDRRANGVGAALGRLARFNGAAGLVSIAGNVVVTTTLVHSLDLPVVAANAAAVLLMSVFTFVVADRFAFRIARRAGVATVVALALWGGSGRVVAAELQPETIAAFDEHVRNTEARIASEAADGARFLSMDFETPQQAARLRARLRRGEIVVHPVRRQGNDEAGLEVPSGLIHHWRGYAFVPDVSVDDLLAALRTPDAHRQEEVLEARVTDQRPGAHVLFLKLQRTGIVTATYNSEHLVTWTRVGRRRATSRSASQRIAEVEGAGSAAERERPVGSDRGFLWRMNSYWRYEASAGGVVVELESITLSRDLPWGISTVARPIVGRVARDAVLRTLASLRGRFIGG